MIHRLRMRKYVFENKDKMREYEKNRHKLRYSKTEERKSAVERAGKWKKKNPKKVSDSYHKNKSKNKTKVKASCARYYIKNKTKILKKTVAYNLRRLKEDPSFKFLMRCRIRMYHALKNYREDYSFSELFGCSRSELSKHLESKFSPGMNFGNYGLHGWHIDHIIPCASFDFSVPENAKKCFHYTNLQPLWAKDNLTKSDSLDWVKFA